VLEYELRRGCDDGAVIGGLDRFLALARGDKAAAAFIAKAPRPAKSYALLSKPARERWLQAVLSGKPAKTSASKSKNGAEAPMSQRITTHPDSLAAPVSVVRGIKGALAAKLEKLDVRTVRDLLYLFPNRHTDFASVRSVADLEVGEEQTTVVTVWSAVALRLGRRDGTQAVVGDDTGTMRVVWFNQPYLAGQLQTNDRIVLAGKVTLFNGLKTMESPEWERLQGDDLTHTGRLVPIYPLTQGLSQRVLRRAVKEAVDHFSVRLTDALPPDLRARHELPDIVAAVRAMHYPDTLAQHEEARRRIAFEELLCVQLAVLGSRLAWEEGRAPAFALSDTVETYRGVLPFMLTGAQERVLGDILSDLQRTRPMARLLEGDVGSGKTAVAAAALAVAAANGYQGALMAPTEILAEQHYRTLSELLGRLRIGGRALRVELLTGSLSGAAKRATAQAVAAGDVDVVVGTHALIQDGVAFHRLGLTIVDEQHRFGVMQRAALRERVAKSDAETPHLLVMSATPIPRTLALTLFGDLDLSVIDEMPPGRLPVETRWSPPDERGAAYGFVREQVQAGRQAFVVCPLIEESAAVASRAATQEYERLSREVFPELRLGLLHGRMVSNEKDAVLEAFRRRELDILVATTVIEVGIDIPNASVMVIEGADRFGLAQLHQLRGRVGRGAEQSYCLLLSDDPSYTARQRLKLLEELNDGFALAEADLRLRGPGDYFGTRQSGLPEFVAADFSDVRLVETARREAQQILAADPGLSEPEHAALAAQVARTRRTVTGEVS
jgi:ATP-dependent DNA helicase RecG